jgi:hypothetical protein
MAPPRRRFSEPDIYNSDSITCGARTWIERLRKGQEDAPLSVTLGRSGSHPPSFMTFDRRALTGSLQVSQTRISTPLPLLIQC